MADSFLLPLQALDRYHPLMATSFLTVIPAKAEALFNSEAGQSSFNTSCEAR
jgi:hypothetical protein